MAMKIFESYILKNLTIGTVFVAVTLTLIVFLTQSLRFLEMILEANTSSTTLWLLTLLALPRFFEIILPLSLMTATLFLYNKMIMDSELIAIRAVGKSPFSLAKPAIALGLVITILLWINAMWVAPASLDRMQKMRLAITAEFSNMLFKEGVFNRIGSGLTVYIHKRDSKGELTGLMIYDSRDKSKPPSTIMAKRGLIIATNEGQQVIVYDGSRQEFNNKSNILQRLDFDRYTIDLPNSSPVRTRWQEPDERTITELLRPDMQNDRDKASLHEFYIEIHRRITGPLLALAFPLIAVTTLLMGELNRRGQAKKIIIAVALVILLQSLYLASYNLTKHSDAGILFMYIIPLLPVAICMFLLSKYGEVTRRKLFFLPAKAANLDNMDMA